MIELQLLNKAMLQEDVLFDLFEYGEEIFSTWRNKEIYKTLEILHSQGNRPDLPALISELKKLELYEKVGGDNLLSELAGLKTIIDHKIILKNLEVERRKGKIRLLSTDFLNKKLTLDLFVDKVSPLFETKVDTEKGIDISDYVDNDFDVIFHPGISVNTGIKAIDKKIGGLFIGDTIIIAARPGEGKTTLALQIAKEIEGNVLFFSFEMERSKLLAKYLQSITGVSAMKILKNYLNDAERKLILEARKEIKKYDITIYDQSDIFSVVLSEMRKKIKQKKSKCVIIDYLQLMSGGKGNNPNERLSYVSRQLKKLAMNEKIPIVVLSQFSRAVEKEKREPVLSDLRDSGCLEQDASTILFLHEGSIIVGKSRLGPTGRINDFIFDRVNSKFIDEKQSSFVDNSVFGY